MKKSSKGRRGIQVLFVTLLLLVGGFVALIRYAYGPAPYGRKASIDQVLRFADAGEIAGVTILDEDAQIVGRRCIASPLPEGAPPTTTPAAGQVSTVCSGTVEKFYSTYPRSDVATQQLIERITPRARLEVDKQTNRAVAKLILTFIFPLLMLANLFGIIFLSRGGDSSIADIAGFGRIGRNRQRKRRASTGITFADVAGAEEAVAELREVTDYLRDPDRFKAFGAAPPKGVLLFGAPGCGKTLLARAVAGETGVPFFSISGAEFVESLVGVGAARVRDLFRQVRAVAPAIVFIDEIDAVGRRRGGQGSSGGEREQTVNQLLVEMDGFEVTSGIVLIGATNRPDILDPALLRPGRFDRHIQVESPDVHGREAIFKLHARNRPVAPDVDFDFLARRTPGFTGADLANVINEGALLALRKGQGNRIDMTLLTEAVQRVLHGPQRRGRLMTPEERTRIAVHEGGHAVVASALGRAGDLHRVSIVARGRGLGRSTLSEDADRVLLTVSGMEAQLTMAMAGVAAEEVRYGESSTTAEDDVDKATALAREMVGRYGMSPKTGRVRLLSREDGYLGGAPVTEVVAEETLEGFDREVRRLIDEAEARAAELLRLNSAPLDSVIDALEREETLEGPALLALLGGVVRPVDADLAAHRNGRGPGGDEPKGRGRTRL